MAEFDIAILGAGAAGLFCAGVAGQRGARVVVLDHASTLGEKIRISGGGRCNFTNLQGDRLDRYASSRPRFARDALRAYPPQRFLELVRAHGIGYHEKHRGQLFCDDSSQRIIDLLLAEARAGGAQLRHPCGIRGLRRGPGAGEGFEIDTDAGAVRARRVVVATGGLSIPAIGATDLGHRLARSLGHALIDARPALVPLKFEGKPWEAFAQLSGLALPARIAVHGVREAPRFDEDLLFTHRGLSGPGILQISTWWQEGRSLSVDLMPGRDLASEWREARASERRPLAALLAEALPRRLAQAWLDQVFGPGSPLPRARLAEIANRELQRLADALHRWVLTPSGSEGWRKAEVTAGGVDVAQLDPRTLESHLVPGLHFIGEVVDVTGWLGGYNFQWAWSSAHAAACAMTPGGAAK